MSRTRARIKRLFRPGRGCLSPPRAGGQAIPPAREIGARLARALLGLGQEAYAEMKPTINWREMNRDTLREAEESNRFIFLVVEAFQVESSQKARRDIASSSTLVNLLKTDYVPVLVDADRAPEVPATCGFSTLPAAGVLSPDGTVEVRFEKLDPGYLARTLKGLAESASKHRLSDRPGLGAVSVPYIGENGQGLDRGLEILETSKRTIEEALDRDAGGGRPDAHPATIEPLRFLLKYGIYTGDQDIHRKVRKAVHALALSTAYDAVEGGFFQAPAGTPNGTGKLLRTNANGLILALRLASDPEASFARPLAQGILHFMQTHLMQAGGAFSLGQRADASYYSLSIDERRKVVAPPVDRRVFSGANAIAVRALCKGWQFLGEESYLDFAVNAYGYLKAHLETGDGTVGRYALDGHLVGPSYLEDQVEMGYAALTLYHSTLESEYLDDLRRTAECIARDFANPAGVGLLDRRLPLGGEQDGFPPFVDPIQNARAAGFLILASGQTGTYELASPAHRILGVLARDPRVQADLETCSHFGYAMLPLLNPPAVFTAVTDGSKAHKRKVLDRIREMDIPFALVVHRPPSSIETMQPLPRLYVQCGSQKKEMTLP